jgi:hypothetical protein
MVGLEYAGQVYGPCCEGLDVHHIVSRGAGGGDEKENLICLCRVHHDMAKTREILPFVFKSILQKRYGYHDRDD